MSFCFSQNENVKLPYYIRTLIYWELFMRMRCEMLLLQASRDYIVEAITNSHTCSVAEATTLLPKTVKNNIIYIICSVKLI